MPHPLIEIVKKQVGVGIQNLPRLKYMAVGIARDFWKDGSEDPFAKLKDMEVLKKTGIFKAAGKLPGAVAAKVVPAKPKVAEWHAAPGEISEKMWGDGFVAPGTEAIAESLIAPLGLAKDSAVLDLSAGLGGRMRATSDKYGVYITGLEPDPEIAVRGMQMSVKAGQSKHASIASYDPNTFSVAKQYDCIIMRETLYRVADKGRFIAAIGEASKPKAQVSFTDYIVNPEDREKPAIKSWEAFEKGASPISLIEMAEAWAKAGYNLRVHEDQTPFYKKEVMAGLKRFAMFLGKNKAKPDMDTRKAILRRIETWVHRMAAMEQGMKFYRFYGTKL